MTLDQALAKVTAEIDAHLEILRRRFEDSLIQNHAPAEDLEDLLNWNEDYQQAWRVRTLAEMRVRLAAHISSPNLEPQWIIQADD